MPSTVVLSNTKRPSFTVLVPLAIALVALQPAGRWTMIAREPCRTGIVSSVSVATPAAAWLSPSALAVGFGASSVPQKGNRVVVGGWPMPKSFAQAPLPLLGSVWLYLPVGLPVLPNVPLQASALVDTLTPFPPLRPVQMNWAGPWNVDPSPSMFDPEHCVPRSVVALAAPGAARAATAAAETAHAATRRRAERNVIA